jgi:hypothetical protein
MNTDAQGGGPHDTAASAVRQELRAAYDRCGRAYVAKDAAAVMALVTPGFTQTMPGGQADGPLPVVTCPEAEALLREWFTTTDVVTGYEVEIGALIVQGDRAEAEIVERVATRFAGPDGRQHDRRQEYAARVTWVRGAQGWQIDRCDYRSGTMTVDGRAVAPVA